MKKTFRLFACLALLGLTALSAFACKDTRLSYSLSQSSINLIFESMDDVYNLPSINTDDKDFTYEWSYKSSTISEPVAFLIGEDKFSLNPIDAVHMVESASTVFTVTIIGSEGTKTLDFTVNVLDKGSDVFDLLYSSQRNSVNYITQGLGKSRVFGLKDLVAPEVVTPSNYTQVTFENSFDEFQLRWNYKQNVDIAVWSEDTSVADVVYNPQTDKKTVRVNFKKIGVVKIVAESTTPYRDDLKARYEYTYDIVDAINTYDFSDVKLIEKLARYNYIANGVNGVNRKDGSAIAGANLTDYIIEGSNPNGLLSAHFTTTATTYPDSAASDDRIGSFFNEFERWAPAYKYKDIVIRSTNKDYSKATRKMYTWAEGTWFFGSVYGNGYELDATTYTRGVQGYTGNYETSGVYRNVHSMRGREGEGAGGASLGFEGKKFFGGYGWGEVFAFYALSNNSIIDNLTLTGENIPQENTAIKLNQYNKIGVLSTSVMAGKDRVFSQGNAHNNGMPIKGLYNEGIRVQNSILEKGLTLFGGSFAPDVNNPIVADTCVFRFGGFAGILGNGYGGGIGLEDTENGVEVAQNNKLANRVLNDDSTAVLNSEGVRHGNFIVARNNIYHDISVAPMLTMPSKSGTYIDVVGNENYFYTWLKSNEIQFPDMKDPKSEGTANFGGLSINSMVPGLLKMLFDKEQNAVARYVQSSIVYYVNIPAISVTDTDHKRHNTISFENSSLLGAAKDDFASVTEHPAVGKFVSRDLDQGFNITMLYAPDNAPATAGLIRVEDINTKHINMKMANMIPAGTKTPTIVSQTFVNLGLVSEFKLMSGLKGYVFGGQTITLAGHKIHYNGQAVESTYNAIEDCFVVTTAELERLGIDKFGLYELSLVSIESNEIVSSFNILLQGSNGTNPNVASGHIIEYELSLESGNELTSLTLLPSTNLAYTYNGGVLSFDASQLNNGENTILISTTNWTITIHQSVVK